MSTPAITVYGAYWCPDCRRSKQFLGEHQIPYNWVNIEEDPDAEKLVIEKNDGKRIIPTIRLCRWHRSWSSRRNAELAARLGLKTTGRERLLRADHHWRRTGRSDHGPVHGARRHRYAGHRTRGLRRPGGGHGKARQPARLSGGIDGQRLCPPAARRRRKSLALNCCRPRMWWSCAATTTTTWSPRRTAANTAPPRSSSPPAANTAGSAPKARRLYRRRRPLLRHLRRAFL